MVEILRQIVQSKNKAWDKTLNDTREKFLVKLDLTVLNELVEKKSQLNIENPDNCLLTSFCGNAPHALQYSS